MRAWWDLNPVALKSLQRHQNSKNLKLRCVLREIALYANSAYCFEPKSQYHVGKYKDFLQ